MNKKAKQFQDWYFEDSDDEDVEKEIKDESKNFTN